MLETDEEALICDLAETYHIFNYKALPLKTVALLASGLRDDSRIKLKLSNQKASFETILLAAAVDRLSILLWGNTEDGQKNRNRPKMIVPQLTGEATKPELAMFSTLEEFEKGRKEILQQIQQKGG